MRRLTVAALCGSLVLAAACSDQTQSPTEPVAPPAQTLSGCRPAVFFPIAKVSGLILKVFPSGKLRIEALARAAAIALLWDTCRASLAQKGVVSFVGWMNLNFQAGKLIGTAAQQSELITTMFTGVGLSSPPTSLGPDYGIGFFTPGTETLVKTQNSTALVRLDPSSFTEPTTIVISRNQDNVDLTDFVGNQFPPNFDYNAINATGTHVLAVDHPAIVAFCLLDSDFGVTYPPNIRIGHNPVGGGFEILDPVEVDPASLNCGNLTPKTIAIGGFGQGLPGLANAAWRTAGHYLGPVARDVFLPEALYAATLGTLPPPIGGKAPSLSPFKVVEPATITPSAGDGQSAPAGSAVPVPPTVLVQNSSDEPVSGVSVTFAVASGGGSITGPTAVTNASGVAAVGSWTLGAAPGTNTLTATAPGLTGSPVVFTATGTPPVTLNIVPGSNNQSGFTNQILTAPLVVIATRGGDAAAGVVVNFAVTEGSITASATTDAFGQAEAHWTLGSTVGSQTATASTTGASPVTFTATATAPPPVRAVLEWGATPSDLDFHLTGPLSFESRFHVYYANPCHPGPDTSFLTGCQATGQEATLDRDDTSAEGPETITINRLAESGTYRFSVHDYSNRGANSSNPSHALTLSGAKVTVYLGSSEPLVFNVPNDQPGTLWTVFTLSGGVITPGNPMLSYESDPGDITAFSILGRTAAAVQSDAAAIREATERHPK